MAEIRVPTLGESVSEATVATWFKKVGDTVKADEMLCDDVVRGMRARGHTVSVICGRGRRLAPEVHGALEIDLDRREETFTG